MSKIRFARQLFALKVTLAALGVFMGTALLSESRGQDQALSYASCPPESNVAWAGPVDVEVGSPAALIDGIGWVFGIPRKISLWDRRADNHNVSQTTIDEVACYIDSRGLHDVKVRVNQYDPGGEWKRLVQNKRVGAGWRYTFGTLSALKYTLFPGRLFGRDHYNPYTDTLSVFSDSPTLALAEAAYAKDVHRRDYPGTYATAQGLPLFALWHETLATGEVLHYVSVNGSSEDQEKVRHLLYARYGMELGGVVSEVLPDGSSLLPVIGAFGGHAVAAGVREHRVRQAARPDISRGVENLNRILQTR